MGLAGKEMSPKLTDYIKKGLEEQSKMVHLDEMHQGEVRDHPRPIGSKQICWRGPGNCANSFSAFVDRWTAPLARLISGTAWGEITTAATSRA